MQLEVYEAAFYSDSESGVSKAIPATQKEKAGIPKIETTVILWLILFVFGGGLLALYYAGIGYLPEVSWQDALTSMALMTIIGGSLLMAYGFLLFVPGAIWSRFLICDEQIHEVLRMSSRPGEPCVLSVMKRILFPFALFMASCHFLFYLQHEGMPGFVALGALSSLAAVSGLLVKDLGEALDLAARRQVGGTTPPVGAALETRRVERYRWYVAAAHTPLLVAFIVEALGVASYAGVLWFGLAWRAFSGTAFLWGAARVPLALLWIAALLPLASLAFPFVERRHQRQASTSAPLSSSLPAAAALPQETLSGQGRVPDRRSLLYRAALAFGIAALLSLAALWFFHRIYRDGAPVPSDLLLVCTVVVIVTNLAVSVLFDDHWRQALLTSFLSALLLLGAGNLLGKEPDERLPAKIMQRFGFGGQNVILVLTERGGRMLCQQKIPVQFEKREPAQTVADQARAPAASVESSENPREAAKDKPQEERRFAWVSGMEIRSRLGSEYLLRFKDRTLALPKDEVVSWSVAPPTLAAQNTCGSTDTASP